MIEIRYSPELLPRLKIALKDRGYGPKLIPDETMEIGTAEILDGTHTTKITFDESMWCHECERAGGFIETELGKECNWCGAKK